MTISWLRERKKQVQFVVYYRPNDTPREFPYIVRPWVIPGRKPGKPDPHQICCYCRTLAQARAPFKHLFPVPAMPEDDAVIIETWM